MMKADREQYLLEILYESDSANKVAGMIIDRQTIKRKNYYKRQHKVWDNLKQDFELRELNTKLLFLLDNETMGLLKIASLQDP